MMEVVKIELMVLKEIIFQKSSDRFKKKVPKFSSSDSND